MGLPGSDVSPGDTETNTYSMGNVNLLGHWLYIVQTALLHGVCAYTCISHIIYKVIIENVCAVSLDIFDNHKFNKFYSTSYTLYIYSYFVIVQTLSLKGSIELLWFESTLGYVPIVCSSLAFVLTLSAELTCWLALRLYASISIVSNILLP